VQIKLSKIHICLSWKIFFWLLWNSIFEVKIAVFAIQNFLSKGLDLYSVPPVSGGPIWFAWLSFPVYLLYLVGCVWFSCPSLYPRLSPVSPRLSPCLNESLSSPPPHPIQCGRWSRGFSRWTLQRNCSVWFDLFGQFCLDWFGVSCRSLGGFWFDRIGLTSFGLVWFALVYSGLTWFGFTWLDLV
jgi:hypothetical protein